LLSSLKSIISLDLDTLTSWPLPVVVFENDGEIIYLIGTPPLAVPEHPEE
jgi:hypothetical protein